MLERGLIISRWFVQVRTRPKHLSNHISDYQSSEHKSNQYDEWLDEIPVYPQERFAYHKRLFWPVLCLKRIGIPCCTFVTVNITCSLQIILLSNYSLVIISVLPENTLLKTACHFLLLLVGFDTLTYRKEYDWSPILVGHQGSFLAPFLGSEALLVSGNQ